MTTLLLNQIFVRHYLKSLQNKSKKINLGMPQHRTYTPKFHRPKIPDMEVVLLDEDIGNSKKYLTIQGVKLLANNLIEDGSCTNLDLAMDFLNELNEKLVKKSLIMLCSACAGKIGIKKCAACPKNSKIRYCSRECQVSDWPVHKMSCGKKF